MELRQRKSLSAKIKPDGYRLLRGGEAVRPTDEYMATALGEWRAFGDDPLKYPRRYPKFIRRKVSIG